MAALSERAPSARLGTYKEYEWNRLRIVDTPGIGAYEGEDDRKRAISVIDESDVLVFLVSSDSIQETEFRAMQDVRDRNKPTFFVLNVKRDLTRAVYLRRFLESSYDFMGKEAIAGHEQRIRKLAYDELGVREPVIIPIHAQAAFLATRPEHVSHRTALHRASHVDDLLKELEDEVSRRGPIRRLQTLLDGTIIPLMGLGNSLRKEAKDLDKIARHWKGKFGDLDTWLDGYIGSINERIERRVSEMFEPLLGEVSSFIDENVEREDVAALWKRRVEDQGIHQKTEEFRKELFDEVCSRLEEFSRQLAVEFEMLGKIEMEGPEQYDPGNAKRTLQRLSVGAGVGMTIALAFSLNPIGWIVGAIGLGILSLFLDDRENNLQRGKGKAARQLRAQLARQERNCANQVKTWFYEEITRKLVRGIREETPRFCRGMFGLAHSLREAASSLEVPQADLNRRLLRRCGECVGEKVSEETISTWIARDPGTRTKCIGSASRLFCQRVGKALGEWIDAQKKRPMQKMIAEALRPAKVDPMKISLDRQSAVVRLPKDQMGRATGRQGSNVRLAERLLKTSIHLREDGGEKP